MPVMPIEWGKVREYARATDAARPVYLDDPHAPIPPTFLATVTFWMPIGETVRRPEVQEACESVGLTAGYGALLSLEQEYVFHGPPPHAGETLTASEQLTSVEVKQGRSGPMVQIRFVVLFHDADGILRAECRYLSAYVRAEVS